MFSFIKSKIISFWYIPVLITLFVILLSFAQCENRMKQDGLRKIIDTNRISYTKQIKVLKDFAEKERLERTKIEVKYDKDIKDLTSQFELEIKKLKEREKQIVEDYIANPDMMIDILKKYGLEEYVDEEK